MPNPIDFIADLTNPDLAFLLRALLVTVLSALVTGVLGCYVVLRGVAFVGDAVSHAVFPGIALAFVLQGSFVLGGIATGIAVGLLIAVLGVKKMVKQDALIGVLYTAAFAAGIVVISFAPGYAGSLQQLLFGSVGAITTGDVLMALAVAAVTIAVVWFFHHGFVLVSLDTELAKTNGIRVLLYDIVLYAAVAASVVVAVQAVGNILVLALLITPAATARMVTNKINVMLLLAPTLGILATCLGMYLSWGYNLPVGGAIVLVATAIFFAVWIYKAVTQNRR